VPGFLDGRISISNWSELLVKTIDSAKISLVLLVVHANDKCDASTSILA